MALVKLQGKWKTVQEVQNEEEIEAEDELRTVFMNGDILVEDTLEDIQARALKALNGEL